MKFPATAADLVLAGYKFVFPRQCRGRNCKVTIYWYETPAGKRMPFSAVADPPPGVAQLEPHFAKCADVLEFRRKP